MDSLQTFEMALNDRSEKKNKSITSMSNTKDLEDQGGESLLEAITLVGRKFNKALRRLDKNLRTNVPDKVSDISPLNKSKNGHEPNRGK